MDLESFMGLTIWITFISSIISYLAYLIKDYFLEKWKGAQIKEVEALKSELEKSNLLVEKISNSISSTYLDTNKRRVENIEQVWAIMMKMKWQIPPLVNFAYKALTREELENLPNSTNISLQDLISQFNPEDFFNSQHELFTQAEQKRPFLGENMWMHFYVYQAFIGRTIFLLYDGLKKGKVKHWKDDEPIIRDILRAVISDDELKKLIMNDFIAFNNILSFLESQVTIDITEQLTGKRITEQSVKYSIDLSRMSQSHEIGLPNSK